MTAPLPTIFNANPVVVDSMVIINYHGLLALDKLLDWTRGEIVVERKVRGEVESSGSAAGAIDLTKYINDGLIIQEEIEGEEQEKLFYHYFNARIEGAIMNLGEAACLALAISKGYGLACDELPVRKEFKKKCPTKICVHSWDIAESAKKMGFVDEDYANDLKKGFYYV